MGPGSVIADVGAGNVFQRGTCCLPAILGGYPSGKQRTTSMRSALHSDNVARRMTAMRNRNSAESDGFRGLGLSVAKILLHKFGLNLRSASAERWRPGNLEKPEYVRPT